MSSFKLLAVALACTVLYACGGGGGGGSDGASSGPSNGAGSGGYLATTVQSLAFVASSPTAPTPDPQSFSALAMGDVRGNPYFTAVWSGPAIASIAPIQIQYSPAIAGMITVTVPSPASLGPGTYMGTITVTACTMDPTCKTGNLAYSPMTINVSYDVAAVLPSAGSAVFSVNNAALGPTDLAQQITINTVPTQSWHAFVDAPWVSVTTSGNSGDVLTATLSADVVGTMTNGTYKGTISVQPDKEGSFLAIQVLLTIARTQVDYVSPYVAYAGTSQNVTIRGNGFSQVEISGVSFGSTPAQSFTVVSPTEIHATYPSTLAPGRYPVSLQTNYANMMSFADLVVVNAPSFTATSIPYPAGYEDVNNEKQPYALVYDAERAAVLVDLLYPNGNSGLVRFPSNGTIWQTPTFHGVFEASGLALTADGSTLIVGSGTRIEMDDPLTLNGTDIVWETPLDPNGPLWATQFSVANDGTIVMLGDPQSGCSESMLLDFNPRKKTLVTPSYQACNGFSGASGDGSRVIIGNASADIGSSLIYSHDPSSGTLTSTGIIQNIHSSPVLDRDGSHIVLDKTRVYDGTFSLLGQLPAATLAVVLRPDGTRAYTYDQSKMLRTFDLTAPPSAGALSEIGTGTTLAGDPGPNDPHMSITPDGRTVFITGGMALVVQPMQ